MVPPLVFREGGRGPWPRVRAPARGLAPVRDLVVHAPCAKQSSCRSTGGWARPQGAGGLGGGEGGSRSPPPLLPGQAARVARRVSWFLLPLVGGVGWGGPPVAVPATPGARGSRSAAAAAPPAVPPTPHFSVGPRATAVAGPRPRGGPSAIASPWGALVGCGRIDTLQPGRGSGHWGHSRRGAAGTGTAAVPTTIRAGRVQQGAGAIWSLPPPPPR